MFAFFPFDKMFSIFPSISVDLGFWFPFLALVGSIVVYGGFAYMMLAKPVELLEKYGYSNVAASPTWAAMVSYMRTLAAVSINLVLLLLAFLIEGCSVGYFSNWSILVAFGFSAGILAAALYRVYVEDPKSPNSSEVSVDSSKKNSMIFGSLTGLCVLAFFFHWYWGPANTGYVIDDYKGLPAELSLNKSLPSELSLLRTSAGKFLKQHILGHQ